MTLTVVHGTMGAGKTLFITILGFYSKCKVVSNYNLDYAYEKFELQKFLEAKYEDCLLLLDEAYIYLESRDSGLNRNKLSSYILFQSRKKNIDMFLTVQLKSTIDVRYRELAGRHIFCEVVKDPQDSTKILGFKYLLLNNENGQHRQVSLSIDKAREYFGMYNTNEVIFPDMPVGEFLTTDQQLSLAKEIGMSIFKKVGMANCTHSFVKLYLVENKHPKFIEGFVYEYIKQFQNEAK